MKMFQKLAVLLELLFLVSSVASVNISLTSGELCEGAIATWTCVVDGSNIGWRHLGEIEFPSSVSPNLVPLGSPSPFSARATCFTGSIITSIATANLTSAVNGSTLECSNGDFTFPSTTTTNVTLRLKESASISFLMLQLISGNIIKLDWGGAQCASHYRIEVNDSLVSTTTETSYNYMIPPNESRFNFTVRGVSYTGNFFTTVSKPFYLTVPRYNVRHFVTVDWTVYIIIESEDVDQLPISYCSVTFNFTVTKICSETSRVIDFPVTPGGSYSYSVEIRNAVGLFVDNDTVTVSPLTTAVCSTVTPSPTVRINTVTPSSIVSSSTTSTAISSSTSVSGDVIRNTACPSSTVSPTSCPEQKCKLCSWAVIVIIVIGVLFVFAVVFIIFELSWRQRCCCEDEDCCCHGFWESSIWTCVFCECFKKDKNNKRVASTNLRTKSPDENKKIDLSEM